MGFAIKRFWIVRVLFLVVVSAASLGASSFEVQSYRDAAQDLQAMLRSGEIRSIRAYIVGYNKIIEGYVTPEEIRRLAGFGCSTQLSDQQRNEIADLFDHVVLGDSDSRGGYYPRGDYRWAIDFKNAEDETVSSLYLGRPLRFRDFNENGYSEWAAETMLEAHRVWTDATLNVWFETLFPHAEFGGFPEDFSDERCELMYGYVGREAIFEFLRSHNSAGP